MSGQRARLLTSLPAHSPVAESFRSLRTNVRCAALETPLRTLLITSPNEGEGKSTSAVNLAMAMAMDERLVVLVDADLRDPTLHKTLDLRPTPGLSGVLTDRIPVHEALCATSLPGLLVLPAGRIPSHPAELLGSDAMLRVLSDLRATADIVILDAPACLRVTDAQVLASRVDGVLMVTQIGKTKKADVEHARELLEHARARTVGVIANRIGRPVAAPGDGGTRGHGDTGTRGHGVAALSRALSPAGPVRFEDERG